MKKQSSISFAPPAEESKELREDGESFLGALRRYADSWISGTGALPDYKINSLIVYLRAENKCIKSLDLDVLKEEKHIQFHVGLGLFQLTFGRKRGKIIESTESVMLDFAKGWTFNILFERHKGKK